MEIENLENEIINVLNQKELGEAETIEVVKQIKETHQNTLSS